MLAIIIGAGRGNRLMPSTADAPKCLAEIAGRSILEWIVEAFRDNGIDRVCFIGGYRIDRVREKYPQFNYRHNTEWMNNNILESLFYAEDLMKEPFICCYSDTLFTAQTIARLSASKADISLVVDKEWLSRYEQRSQHPTDDAEKVTVSNGVVTQIRRGIVEADAYGEFIGVAKFSRQGAAILRKHYRRCRRRYGGAPFRGAKVFEKAYLIHLFQEMIELGERMVHVDTPGGYVEIDTQEDYEYARRYWKSKHLGR